MFGISGIGAIIRAIVALVIVLVIAGGAWYVTGLRANLAQSEANNEKLVDATQQQNDLIDSMKRDIAQIQKTNQQLAQENERQRRDVDALNKKFSKDLGQRAIEAPVLIENAVNRGTVNAMRCLEIASGAPLNDREKSAKTPTEANRECPSLIDSDYTAPAR